MGKTPNAALDACFPASTPGLAAALSEIEELCATHALPRDLVSRALIIVEELFTNTVKYGYGGECERPVRLKFSADNGMTLVFEDEAGPFDPTQHEVPEALPNPARPGRAGIAMVLRLSSSVRYDRLPEGNRLTIRLLT